MLSGARAARCSARSGSSPRPRSPCSPPRARSSCSSARKRRAPFARPRIRYLILKSDLKRRPPCSCSVCSPRRSRCPAPGEALAGRRRADPHRRNAFRQRPAAQGPLPGGPAEGALRPRLLLGRGARLLEDAGRLCDRRRLCRRHDAQPDLPGGLHRPHRPQRGRARRLRPEGGQLCASCCSRFWEAHDPTQGMRQGNDVGTQYRSGIYVFDDEQRRQAEASRAMYQDALGKARGAITTEILPGAGVLLRRGLSPAISGEEPGRLLRPRRHRRQPARSTKGRWLRNASKSRKPHDLRIGDGLPAFQLGVRTRIAWAEPG